MTPLIFTLTGPTCAGKSTLEGLLLDSGFAAVISTTTRPMRKDDVNGEDYYFLNQDEFDFQFDQGNFVEKVEFGGNSYGVTKGEIERVAATGKPIVIVVEPNGREQIDQYVKAMKWRIYKTYIGAPADAITQRFLKRFFADALNEQMQTGVMSKTHMRYADRMMEIMTTERHWAFEALYMGGIYDLVVHDFNEEAKSSVTSRLMEIAEFLRHAD